MDGPTNKQALILDFIRGYAGERGYPPTLREIGGRFGFSWIAAKGHLRALEKKGLIKLRPNTSRGMELARDTKSDVLSIPLLGAIRAGEPIYAMQDMEARITLDKSLFKDEDAFVLRVKGDSMKGDGILDGDYVIVKPASTIGQNDIGVALIGDEATVKRIRVKGGKVILAPSNETMMAMTHPASDVKILGRVMGVIRKR